METNRSLYILCGGNSRRMGTDKSNLELRGETFLNTLTQKAELHFSEIYLLSGSHQWPSHYPHLEDEYISSGPLGGLLTALNHSNHTSVAIMPVDLPLVQQKTLEILRKKKLDSDDVHVAICDEQLQPLLGIYSCELKSKLKTYLLSHKKSVKGFLDIVKFQTFQIGPHEIRNINTPEEYEELIATFKSHSDSE